MTKITVKDICEAAILIASAIFLDLPFLKIKTPFGSISFTMLPLLVLAVRKDFWKSFVFIGVCYGLITCILDNWGFITFPLDYLLGYGSLSIISFFRKRIYKEKINIVPGIFALFLCFISRLFFASCSGTFIFGLNFLESVVSNLIYIGPSFIISGLVFVLLLKPIQLIE